MWKKENEKSFKKQSESGKKARYGTQHEREDLMADVSDTHFHMGRVPVSRVSRALSSL